MRILQTIPLALRNSIDILHPSKHPIATLRKVSGITASPASSRPRAVGGQRHRHHARSPRNDPIHAVSGRPSAQLPIQYPPPSAQPPFSSTLRPPPQILRRRHSEHQPPTQRDLAAESRWIRRRWRNKGEVDWRREGVVLWGVWGRCPPEPPAGCKAPCTPGRGLWPRLPAHQTGERQLGRLGLLGQRGWRRVGEATQMS